ncbi:LLM class F420-dependent oxidoreductase [Streptomyces violaceusniger]|uniref:F420-dependent oxidoreductase n=1 Tax=Streptomyces violaceusniger (strain Tu 4113) TaxID=653045 RepID=G2PAZ7_STRV4|nr:LLM class F420-dependent oxidoreductase [Streptomyces violaceusniger]AEM88396.1 putative F420-dependent oxidoreductase [Streptomyces violaceusniger Tu 4113]
MSSRPALGKIGVWTAALKTDSLPSEQVSEVAAELDELGYGAIWLGGSPSPDQAGVLLDATSRITIATGILSIWDHEAAYVAERHTALNAAHDGRFLLGLGVSHSALAGERYRRPYTAMKEYLTALDSAPSPVPASQRVLAALGPKMLELARDRAAGAHPYLVTPEHTAEARDILGKDSVLAPELKVVLDTDLDRARTTARGYLARYLALPNYTNNFRRLGFEDADFADGGSDRLISAMFALGDAEVIRARVDEFLAAGADHVAIQAVTESPLADVPRAQWRTLAEALPLDKG